MGFSRQGCWSGLPFPSPVDLPDPGIEPWSPALQADALPSEPPGKPTKWREPCKPVDHFVLRLTLCISNIQAIWVTLRRVNQVIASTSQHKTHLNLACILTVFQVITDYHPGMGACRTPDCWLFCKISRSPRVPPGRSSSMRDRRGRGRGVRPLYFWTPEATRENGC